MRENKEYFKQYTKKYRAARYADNPRWMKLGKKAVAKHAWIEGIKSEKCSDCKRKYPTACMDFDHVRGTKSYNIAHMVKLAYSIEAIKKELEKCELVCSNCHRIRTRDRMKKDSN